MTQRGVTPTRSQAESWIKLGRVTVNGQVVTKPGQFVDHEAQIVLSAVEQYVSRAGLKLASVANGFGLTFANAVVLDVGSSTGGFTDYALQHGAATVYAVDVGTDQLHPSLRGKVQVEVYEKTDIRDVYIKTDNDKRLKRQGGVMLAGRPDIVLVDVSFISVRQILPHIVTLAKPSTQIVVMVKPQFEAVQGQIGRSGVIKNDGVRRTILKDFEQWAKQYFIITAKADSTVKGARGNQERFFVLHPKNISK